jgi:hypothetical protein
MGIADPAVSSSSKKFPKFEGGLGNAGGGTGAMLDFEGAGAGFGVGAFFGLVGDAGVCMTGSVLRCKSSGAGPGGADFFVWAAGP